MLFKYRIGPAVVESSDVDDGAVTSLDNFVHACFYYNDLATV